ncbi:MAG: subclass B3 metallo-beta-lactamase [Erythrobacter sp.]|nr:subclass B3 metallo-beta-lactamase [Erythrobacter sp.]
MSTSSISLALAALASLGGGAAPAMAQGDPDDLDTQMRTEWTQTCADWDEWDKPGPPFRVFANTWYVGTCGIAAILVADGHGGFVLIDSGTDAGAQVVLDNLQALAIDPHDIGMVLESHEHWDHVGGMARIAEATGHGVVTSREAWRVFATGQPDPRDPQFSTLEQMRPVEVVNTVTDGTVVGVGNLRLTAIATPGHTPGALTWQWQSCDDNRCLTVVYADSLSPVQSDPYRYSDHPEYVDTFRDSLARLAELDCDVLLTPHPSASQMRDRLLAGDLSQGMNCAEYAEIQDARLSQRLALEAGQ